MANMVNVSDESKVVIEKYAKHHGIEKGEATDRLIGVAKSRLNALARYAAKGDAPAPAAKKTAKKAKGPIARKAAKA